MTSQTQHKTSSTCPFELKNASLQLDYLTEGAANIIYNVSVESPPTLAAHSGCCVMRLRKDLPFTKPCLQVMSDFENHIVPLFTHDRNLLLNHSLYKLTPEMVNSANEELRRMESVDLSALSADEVPHGKIRYHIRRHVYLPNYEQEQYGILMQNLQGSGIDWLVEFKPKWLLQSPSAPADAKNCRTCALNASRVKAGKAKGRGYSGFCPWDLLSKDEKTLRSALTSIWPVDEGIENFVAAFKDKVQPALRHLTTLQRRFGHVGVKDFLNPEEHDFEVAMALRDCSVFLALRRSLEPAANGQVEIIDVKFADLDLKSTEGGKLERWTEIEQGLLDGGWYYSAEDSDCALARD